MNGTMSLPARAPEGSPGLEAASPDVLETVATEQRLLAEYVVHGTSTGEGTKMNLLLDIASRAVDQRSDMVGTVLPTNTLPAIAQQGHNLDTAAELLALLDDAEQGDSLRRAVGFAQVATKAQAHTMGLDWVEPARTAPTGQAAAPDSLGDGTFPTAETLGTDRFQSLSQPVRLAVSDLVAAFASFEAAVAAAYGNADIDRLQEWSNTNRLSDEPTWQTNGGTATPPGFDPLTLADVDLSPVFPARNALLDHVVNLASLLEPLPMTANQACEPIQQPPWFSIDLTDCDNVYTRDFALIIDAGGNDAYHNNAGGSAPNGVVCPLTSPEAKAAALFDFGGDDIYGDPASPRGCGVNGGGAYGAGILVDTGGDDAFHALEHGTNGGGNFGTGLLINAGGQDSYIGDVFGVNGGSEGGAGMLVDLDSDDTYVAGSRGTNGGSFGGSGFLLDLAGNDGYQGGSQATNGGGGASGAGFLFDAAGNDHYSAGRDGTNGGGTAIQGAGFLLDGGGNDTFGAGPYGTNGGGYGAAGVGMLISGGGTDEFVANERGTNGGAHGYGAAGFLMNGDGDTTYQGGHSGANGGARQGAVGAIIDLGGDDVYFHVAPPNPPHPPFQGSFGTNGGGYLGGVGALIDAEGDDVYRAGHSGVSGGGWRTGVQAGILIDSVALLFDAAGTDYYEDRDLLVPGIFGSCSDCSLIPKGNSHGAQIDYPNLS